MALEDARNCTRIAELELALTSDSLRRSRLNDLEEEVTALRMLQFDLPLAASYDLPVSTRYDMPLISGYDLPFSTPYDLPACSNLYPSSTPYEIYPSSSSFASGSPYPYF